MKILMINPPSVTVYAGFQRAAIKRLPLGLAYVAAFLKKHGHRVEVIDAEAEELSMAEIAARAVSFGPEFVGTTATTPLIHSALDILREMKDLFPNVKTMIGGPHISAMPRETLEANRNILDVAVFGEGEHTALEVVSRYEREGKLEDPIAGAVFLRSDGRTVMGTTRHLEKDLYVFPYPVRELFPMDHYVDDTKFGMEPYTLVTTSRGCPAACTFCGSQITWGRTTRFRSAANVIGEIRECMDRWGIKNFVFCDDTFTLRKEHAISICREITRLPHPIRLFCSSRVDTISEDRLYWLKKAGCYCITFGIESGDDAILTRMQKGSSVEKVRAAVAMTKMAGIGVHGSFIIGNAGDTEETIEQTISFACELDLDQVQFSILVPLPGTECYRLAQEQNAFRGAPDDFEKFYWYYSVAANLTDLPDERLLQLQKEAYERWHDSKRRKAA